ncbi:hypothetical protein JYU34_015951 [Plutella xylostella]|uniref:Uncharacterized protein n=1 Tax=Plutella xylostella TaxID=51655 RepID=A0ABQ7Q531_PLUXY|nr:hypothetical protein JYU34_015951 [Plutella xylostella]
MNMIQIEVILYSRQEKTHKSTYPYEDTVHNHTDQFGPSPEEKNLRPAKTPWEDTAPRATWVSSSIPPAAATYLTSSSSQQASIFTTTLQNCGSSSPDGLRTVLQVHQTEVPQWLEDTTRSDFISQFPDSPHNHIITRREVFKNKP